METKMDKPTDGILTFLSCDTLAECYDVSTETYKELWAAMENAKPLSELIDIEDSCPNDALGLNTPAQFWDSFSDDAKRELLALAEQDDADDEDDKVDPENIYGLASIQQSIEEDRK
jgi:hypothetical protein